MVRGCRVQRPTGTARGTTLSHRSGSAHSPSTIMAEQDGCQDWGRRWDHRFLDVFQGGAGASSGCMTTRRKRIPTWGDSSLMGRGLASDETTFRLFLLVRPSTIYGPTPNRASQGSRVGCGAARNCFLPRPCAVALCDSLIAIEIVLDPDSISHEWLVLTELPSRSRVATSRNVVNT